MNNDLVPTLRRRRPTAYSNPATCPFFRVQITGCLAAKRMTLSAGHQRCYCQSDDHDNCPLYLCQALRSSAPGGFDRDPAGSRNQ